MKYLLLSGLFFISGNLFCQPDSIRNFIFGHSLINHEFTTMPPESDELTVPHWLYFLADHTNKGYAASGQYGFLRQHDDLPPIAQWGYDFVPPVWESDYELFSEADFTTILITAGNFIQYQGPNVPYYDDPDDTTPLSATITIIDWVEQQEDGLRTYIYENWPDMAGFIGSFPPTDEEMVNYNNYTENEFHDWWIEYHDSLRFQRPLSNIKMIPVGPIIAELYNNTSVGDVPITSLYEDDAPHGKPSIYFLASLITYMAYYQEPAPLDFPIPSVVNSAIVDNYESIVQYIWTELLNFNDNNGESRVFFDSDIINSHVYLGAENITVFPNPSNGIFHIKGELDLYTISVLDNVSNTRINYINSSELIINISDLPSGLYFVKIENKQNGTVRFQKIIKTH